VGGPREYSDVRYLRAKRSVDQRALNRPVWEQLRAAVARLSAPVRVLELGAGVGTTVSRLGDLGAITRARYTLVDQDRASLAAAADDLRAWGGGGGDGGDAGPIIVRDGGRDLQVRLVAANVFDWLAAEGEDGASAGDGGPFDLVVAHAFLDLVDVAALLPALWRRVGPARPFWFTINFDGETIFLPERPFDDVVIALYHQTMDQRVREGRPAGDSHAGRHLLQQIPQSGARLLGAGSSDWVVWPSAERTYPEDEAYFLHHIVHTIHGALAGSPSLDARALAAWVDDRHGDVDRGELIYIAHQLDLVGQAPG
jgi:SAM-dependent methyltransferase